MKEHKRYMRIMVFFDLPVKKEADRKVYNKFRKFLIKDGYDMLQYSVYSRFCVNLDQVNKHEKRLQGELPKRGSVRAMIVTDKQYGEMQIMVGEKTSQEELIGDRQLIMF